MARFDVYKFAGAAPYVIDVQADIFTDLKTRVLIPLHTQAAKRAEHVTRLTPELHISGQAHLLSTAEMAAMPASILGEPIANLEDQRQVIIDAIDFLLQGF